MKNRLGIGLAFLIAAFIHLGDLSEARICPPKGNGEGVIIGVENSRGSNGGSNVNRVADTKSPKDKPLIAQPSPAGEEKKPTKTEEHLASLKDLKDKTGGAIDLLKPKADAKKGKPDKGKTGTKPEKKEEVDSGKPPLPPDDDVAGGGTGSGPRLSHADREKIKNKYGAEDVVGTKGDVYIQKDGKWMQPKDDDPTKDPLYASAQNLLEAKQFDRSGQQQIDYGTKRDQFGSDLSKKLEDMQTSLVESTKQKKSSTDSSKKTKQDDKVPPGKDFKCQSNQDCWTKYGSNQYYCDKGKGECIKCPDGSHGKKDGTAECCSDEPIPGTGEKTKSPDKFPKSYTGTILITLPGCSSSQPMTVVLEDHDMGPNNLLMYKYNLVATYGFSITYDKTKGIGTVEAKKLIEHYGYHSSDGKISILTLGVRGQYTDTKLDGEGGYKKSGVNGNYTVKYRVSLNRQN